MIRNKETADDCLLVLWQCKKSLSVYSHPILPQARSQEPGATDEEVEKTNVSLEQDSVGYQ